MVGRTGMAASARDVPGAAGAGAGPGAAGWPYVHGYGLWVVRLLADQMSAVSWPRETCVTVRFARH